MSEDPVVYLIDDDARLVRGLARLLVTEGLAAQTYRTAEDFILAHEYRRPGCVVIGARLPGLDGLGLQRALHGKGEERLAILMSDRGDAATAIQAMKAGAVDVLVKPFGEHAFMEAVRLALARDREARQVRGELESVRGRLATLTAREHEVLDKVLIGRLNKQIAADLGITEKTIKVHRARVMEKMGVETLAQLVRTTLAVEVGAAVECACARAASRAGCTCGASVFGRALCLMGTRSQHPH